MRLTAVVFDISWKNEYIIIDPTVGAATHNKVLKNALGWNSFTVMVAAVAADMPNTNDRLIK